MPKDLPGLLSTIIKLAIISFVVGWLLVQFDISPEDIFADFGETVRRVYEAARGAIEWSAGYIVIGAVLVVPLWVVSVLLDRLKGRRRNKD